ncbi:MAG TPA: FAD-binding oxidoreductase [Thermodesulfobacteriota bacterium]|nr:FAD-binding oxidoreductase [Thermodesulfobacteriota bacterium]
MKNLLNEITNIVGEDNILSSPTELEQYSVNGKTPSLVVLPKTVEEISEILKLASREPLAIIPWGGGTKIALGREPENVDVVLCTKNFNRVLEYEPSDLVATAECGISLKGFQEILRGKNQFLAVDPPHLNRGATLGGIIATNDNGPRRLRYGSIRESLIGVKVVRPDGSIVKGGAKVVKNVAGYDIPKLYIGSLGTLGIIVEATFRLYSIPETSQTYLAGFPDVDRLQEAVLSILNSSLVPTCMEVVNPALITDISHKLALNLNMEEYALAVRIESVEKAVIDQIAQVQDICRNKGGEGVVLESRIEENLWLEIRGFPWGMGMSEKNATVCKASVLITDVPKVLRALDELSKNSGLDIYASGRAGNGVLIILLEGEITSVIEATRLLRALAISSKGSLVIQEAPSSLKSKVDVWGEIGTSLKVMEKLKSLFDPNRILNPGRFVGGI